MSNEEHLAVLNQSVEHWNAWRQEHQGTVADLSWADLEGRDLRKADLSQAYLREANLSRANLAEATLWKADLYHVRLIQADLTRANLRKANPFEADLTGANLTGANLTGTLLVDATLQGAMLVDCIVYGSAVWGIKLDNAIQANLRIVDAPGEHGWQPDPTQGAITVPDLQLAQFIFLLRDNRKIRQVIDTLTAKVVLILGRFTQERKAVLDAIREELFHRDYLGVVFDFEKPESRDLTETITALAHMSRFIIADITEPRSIPQELEAIVPHLTSVPVCPIIDASATEYGMFEHFRHYPWVLQIYHYQSLAELLASLKEHVIDPAEDKARELWRDDRA